MENSRKSATLKRAIIHYVGNKNNGDPLHLSNEALQLPSTVTDTLGDAFLSKFNTAYDHYSFTHTSSLQFNEVHSFALQLFAAPDTFTEASVSIARHLYETAVHPKIKAGELYVCGFEGLPFESRVCKAIGLFKTEHKSIFLDVAREGGS
ncbi:MAG: nucleoid-associated protein, partial [Chitinophagaceae bacterium]